MLFLGNKAFVIDFLETGITLLSAFAAKRERIVLGEYISPLEFRRAYCSNLSGVLLLSVNKWVFQKKK